MSDQYSLEDQEDVVVLKSAWQQVLSRFEQELPESVNRRFIKPLKPDTLEGDKVYISAPGQFVQEWVKEKYSGLICSALADELGREVVLEFRSSPRENPARQFSGSNVSVAAPSAEPRPSFKPSASYRFDSFVVGQSNRLAFAGANAVARDPGKKYNPLFIYGSSGLGKTHLLHAIANEIIANDPRFPVMYISAQQFAEDFVQALQNGRIDQFRRAQRSVNIWLLDDIQFVAGKDRTQEEIFHTFNYLQSLGKQIVLCSDRPPRDLLLMDERLRSRLEAGLVTDVQMPDTELRGAIILKKAERDGVPIEHEVAMYLAESVPGNVRILEGALTKLAAQASLTDEPISLGLAEDLVDRYYRSVGNAKPDFGQILETVSKHYKVPVDQIEGTSRKAPIAHARHVAVYVTREITGDSWKHIGALFGNRDHTSMMHAYTKIRSLMDRDKDLNAAVKTMMRQLYPEV